MEIVYAEKATREYISSNSCLGLDPVERRSVSSEAMDRLGMLSERMMALNGRLYDKLDSVMTPPCPVEANQKAMTEQTWPRYFTQMRDLCNIIERNIDSMEEALSRTEL